jgi:hypothetical protein
MGCHGHAPEILCHATFTSGRAQVWGFRPVICNKTRQLKDRHFCGFYGREASNEDLSCMMDELLCNAI